MKNSTHTPALSGSQAAIDATMKFRWLNALNAAGNISARALKVALAIANHINAKTGTAFVGSDTLADETGLQVRAVERGRDELRKAGWLGWRRTGSANVYWPLLGEIERIENALADLKIVRDERRQQATHETKNRRVDPTPASDRNHVRPDTGVGSRPDTHVGHSRYVEPVKEKRLATRKVSVEDTGTTETDARRWRGRPRRYGPPPWVRAGKAKSTWYRHRAEERDRKVGAAYSTEPISDKIRDSAVRVMLEAHARARTCHVEVVASHKFAGPSPLDIMASVFDPDEPPPWETIPPENDGEFDDVACPFSTNAPEWQRDVLPF